MKTGMTRSRTFLVKELINISSSISGPFINIRENPWDVTLKILKNVNKRKRKKTWKYLSGRHLSRFSDKQASSTRDREGPLSNLSFVPPDLRFTPSPTFPSHKTLSRSREARVCRERKNGRAEEQMELGDPWIRAEEIDPKRRRREASCHATLFDLDFCLIAESRALQKSSRLQASEAQGPSEGNSFLLLLLVYCM